jgi:hypothetical protein
MTTPDDPATAQIQAAASLFPELLSMKDELHQFANGVAELFGIVAPKIALTLDTTLAGRAFRLAGSDAAHHGEAPPAGSILVRSSPLTVSAHMDIPRSLLPQVPDPLWPSRRATIVSDRSLAQVQKHFDHLALRPAQAAALTCARWLNDLAVAHFDEVSAAQILATLPFYDAAALLRTLKIDGVTALMRKLLAERVPLYGFGEAAPLLADETRVWWTDDERVTIPYPGRCIIAAPRPMDECERRRVIARAQLVPAWLRQLAQGREVQLWVLDELQGWMPPTDAPAEVRETFAGLLFKQLESMLKTEDPILLTSAAQRASIANAMRDRAPWLSVIGLHELPSELPVRRRGSIRVAPPPPTKGSAQP